jgi:septum site-determining protein MinD
LKQQFDYIVCDSPAGIEHGAITALYFADSAIIVTNPEVSSVRDSDRIIGILSSRSRRAERNEAPVEIQLLLTRYDPARVAKGDAGDRRRQRDPVDPAAWCNPRINRCCAHQYRHLSFLMTKARPGGPTRRGRTILGEQREMRFVEPERRLFPRSVW